MEKALKRNTTLDLFKLFAAYAIVFIHVGMYGSADVVADGLCRFAVSLFFISSGFFCYYSDTTKLKKKIKSTLNLYLISALMYYIFHVVRLLLSEGSEAVVSYLSGALSIKSVFIFLVFNQTYSSLVLWFLAALIYVYVIQFAVRRFNIGDKAVFTVAVIGLILHVLLGESVHIFGIELPKMLTRNFLLPGYSLFGMGMLAKKQENKLMNIHVSVPIVCITAGSALAVLSACTFGKSCIYFGSVLVLFGMVVISVKYPRFKHSEKLGGLLSCSKYVYLFHIIVTTLFTSFTAFAKIETDSPVARNLRPFIICILTTLLGVLLVEIEKRIKLRSIRSKKS